MVNLFQLVLEKKEKRKKKKLFPLIGRQMIWTISNWFKTPSHGPGTLTERAVFKYLAQMMEDLLQNKWQFSVDHEVQGISI